MTILNASQIQKELRLKNIRIVPSPTMKQMQGASIDLHVDDVFRIFQKTKQPITLTESIDYRQYTTRISAKSIIIQPHETILGITRETISLPSNICGWLEGRSKYARLGLLVHISAGLVHPGVHNKQVLEISNLSVNPLKLCSGTKICQLVLQYVEGTSVYSGRFADQVEL